MYILPVHEVSVVEELHQLDVAGKDALLELNRDLEVALQHNI